MAVPTYYYYTLGETECPSGTLTVDLLCEISSLTIPEGIAKTLSIGPIMERYVITDEASEALHTNVGFVEDYSEYAQGFWFKVLTAGHVELHLILDEGNGDTHLFKGRVVEFNSGFEEVSLISGDIIRTGSFMLADAFVERFNDITMDELYTKVHNASYYVTVGSERFVTMKYLFSGMLSLAFGQAVNTADITQSSDALGYNANSDWRDFLDLSIIVSEDLGAGFGKALQSFNAWENRGWSALDLFRHICRSHCVYPRHVVTIDAAGPPRLSSSELVFVAKGSHEGFSTYLTEPRKPSSSILSAPRHITSVRNIMILNGSDRSIWIEGEAVSATDLPPNTTFDVNLEIDWTASVSYVGYLFYISGGTRYYITQSRHYANGWSAADASSLESVSTFMHQNWGSDSATLYGYERVYPGLGLSDGTTEEHTHVHMGPPCWIQINDGVATKSFFPIEIEKDIMNDTLRIVWRETAT